MTALDRWTRVRSLLEASVDRPPGERKALLEKACSDTPDIRAEVESLLRAHDAAGRFLEGPSRSETDAMPPPAPPLERGTRLGPFEILAPLGAGGMSRVYRARDTRLGREVALKLLAPSFTVRAPNLAWLEHEARAISRLAHPHICVLHDIGMASLDDGAPCGFLVMELVEGDTLADRLERGALPPEQAAVYGAQMAEALAAAHHAGIVHGDLKPSNIVLSRTGVKLLDFGLARLAPRVPPTATDHDAGARSPAGAFAGTLPYMAPEMLRGHEADARSDIHALGVVLYEMVSGNRPFQGPSPVELMAAIEDDPPRPLPVRLRVPGAFARVIEKCLAKEPQDRWQHAHDVALALATLPDGTTPRANGLRASGRRALVLGAVVCTLVIALAGAILDRLEPRPAAPHVTRGPDVRSLAVLPFENLSGEPGHEYLADGMTEAVNVRLSALKGPRVISSWSAMQFKGTPTRVADISKVLNVDAVVAGTMQRDGGRVRVSAQLIAATTGETLWSGTFDRDASDVLGLQTELAFVIGQQIDRALAGPESGPSPVAPDVYEKYLEGLFELRKQTRPSLAAALAHFEGATAKDPSFALAHLGAAEAYTSMASLLTGTHPPAEVRPRAMAAVRRALDLNPQLAQGHALLGRLEEEEWHWAEAEAHYRRALSLNPSSAEAHAGLGWLLVCRGRLDEGLALSRLGRELDPLSPRLGWMLGVALNSARRNQEAREVFEGVLARHPEDAAALAFLGLVWLDLGQPAEAIRVLERAVLVSDRNAYYLGMLAASYGRGNRRGDAHRIVEELQRRREREYVTSGAFLFAFTGLGDIEAAMTALDEAYNERANILKWVKVGPVFDDLRGSPRFERVVRRVGLD